jgi:hypothetical protein
MPLKNTLLCTALTLGFVWPAQTLGQKLPTPSRTVFKCETEGKIYYSDSPCLAATKIDVEPTRGVSKLSGNERTGSDVRHERSREDMAEALRPLTGMDAKQTEVFGRRLKLSESARLECVSLDKTIAQSEAEERKATMDSLRAVQRRLFTKRTRYRELGC